MQRSKAETIQIVIAAGQEAGFTLEHMIALLEKGVTVESLLRMIEWRLSLPLVEPCFGIVIHVKASFVLHINNSGDRMTCSYRDVRANSEWIQRQVGRCLRHDNQPRLLD